MRRVTKSSLVRSGRPSTTVALPGVSRVKGDDLTLTVGAHLAEGDHHRRSVAHPIEEARQGKFQGSFRGGLTRAARPRTFGARAGQCRIPAARPRATGIAAGRLAGLRVAGGRLGITDHPEGRVREALQGGIWSKGGHLEGNENSEGHREATWTRVVHLEVIWTRGDPLGGSWTRGGHQGATWTRGAHQGGTWTREDHLAGTKKSTEGHLGVLEAPQNSGMTTEERTFEDRERSSTNPHKAPERVGGSRSPGTTTTGGRPRTGGVTVQSSEITGRGHGRSRTTEGDGEDRTTEVAGSERRVGTKARRLLRKNSTNTRDSATGSSDGERSSEGDSVEAGVAEGGVRPSRVQGT